MISWLLQIERHLPKRKDRQIKNIQNRTYISNQVKADINTSATCSYRSKIPIYQALSCSPTWHLTQRQRPGLPGQDRAGVVPLRLWIMGPGESQQEWLNQGQNNWIVLFHKYLANLIWLVKKFRTFYNVLRSLEPSTMQFLCVWTTMIFSEKGSFWLWQLSQGSQQHHDLQKVSWLYMILPHLPISKLPGGCPWPNRVIQLVVAVKSCPFRACTPRMFEAN